MSWSGFPRKPPVATLYFCRTAGSPPKAIYSTTGRPKETPMITAIVFYDLPSHIGLKECRVHFT
jgi:hypothetical protein